MNTRPVFCLAALLVLVTGSAPRPSYAGPAAQLLTVKTMLDGRVTDAPIDNAAFTPDHAAMMAPAFSGLVTIAQSTLQTQPELTHPVVDGRDARLFPAITLEFFTIGSVLVPVQRGEMVRETGSAQTPSYWRAIPQFGRVWHESVDGGWSRAAFPLMLVNDLENHAHQGIATFLYRDGAISSVRCQFVQQSAPYLLKQHFVMWGFAAATFAPGDLRQLDARRRHATAELAGRLPAKPWSKLLKLVPTGILNGFGGSLNPKWTIMAALVRKGTLYYQESATPYGPYPYPLELRFGVRSVMKSIAAPLSLLRLAQVYGPYVLTLRIGDYVKGLDPKYDRVRFIDAANMASGFGGTGAYETHPNNIYSGYLDGDYDAWYTAGSNAEKINKIAAGLRPYPWEPGTVVRYRDQDFYLLGVAIDAFLKSVRGPKADAWEMLQKEVFAPIGIEHAPTVRTREAADEDGVAWFNAGYYPTLDDLAKIALLYQNHGQHNGRQILHRQLTIDLLAGRGALVNDSDASDALSASNDDGGYGERYRMGFHFTPFVGSRSHRHVYLPTMSGYGENQVILYPNHLISIRMANATELPEGQTTRSQDSATTIRAVDRLVPF